VETSMPASCSAIVPQFRQAYDKRSRLRIRLGPQIEWAVLSSDPSSLPGNLHVTAGQCVPCNTYVHGTGACKTRVLSINAQHGRHVPHCDPQCRHCSTWIPLH
jgi:hypothetical protein